MGEAESGITYTTKGGAIMIDLGNCYFCCDECPIIEGLDHRLKLAEEYGELQLEYCGCDKTEYEFFLGGYCTDAYLPKEKCKRRGQRKTGSAYRRQMKKQKFERAKKIATRTYNPAAGYVDWEYVNGELIPVGKYVKYPKNSNKQQYFKRYSNKRVRRSSLPSKGNAYRRCFNYWWTMY